LYWSRIDSVDYVSSAVVFVSLAYTVHQLSETESPFLEADVTNRLAFLKDIFEECSSTTISGSFTGARPPSIAIADILGREPQSSEFLATRCRLCDGRHYMRFWHPGIDPNFMNSYNQFSLNQDAVGLLLVPKSLFV
jgi:hypothetical protein